MFCASACVQMCVGLPVCVLVWLQGPCVRGAEHLNINNCHVSHLGPHSQLAPWAHSHHQHSCHREGRGWGYRKRERETEGEKERRTESRDVGEEVGDKTESQI